MSEIAREILPVNLEDEMRQSYLDYAMSVIVGRALPDVRDGLKPVHRRVLFAMRELGNDWNKPYKKSARVVGDVIGKYHPHGDSAVYDAIVRMAQPFSMRYMLADGQGNFGSVDGDMPAAMRYTEVRMARIAHELLADIDKETVDFVPNYDESEQEPAVLPARIPNLLINGASGIAVGMATNIPPHNLTEVVNALLAVLDDPEISLAQLMQHLPGPDFPTAGIINGAAEIITAYKTGRGRLSLRGRAHFEEVGRGDRQAIVITELPYQVNKARLIERIADLVREKQIDGIAPDGLRDESDKDGMRIVIELKRGEVAEVVLNNLYAQTPLETVFGINMVALVDGQPRLCSLREMLDAFIRHRREVVTRRTVFDLRKARERAHLLEGLAVALANIDEVIALIKASPTMPEARVALMSRAWPAGAVPKMLERAGAIDSRPDGLDAALGLHDGFYRLSEAQANAILEMRLSRLTGLEQDKILTEYGELLLQIVDLLDILARPERLTDVVRNELVEVRDQFGDARRTEISLDHLDLRTEDLIEPQDVVVTFSHAGYAKSQPVSDYQAQRRGRHQGRGLHREAVRGAYPRHAAVLLQPRPGVLAARIRTAAGRSHLARQADREPAAAGRGREDHRGAAHQAVRRGAFRLHGDQERHREEDGAVGLLASARHRHHRRGPARRRPARGRAAHRRKARDHAVHQRRQGHPLPRGGGATDGSRLHRRARRKAGRGSVGDLAGGGGRGAHPHRLGQWLRQAHAARGLPGAWPRRPGRDRAADHRTQWRDRRGAAGHAGPGADDDQLQWHAGAHPRGRGGYRAAIRRACG
jgi:DNA gyrase subunit A